ncbi:uncharacterized protein ColSpa_10150 [Colletotrichum spaethianum]|uniref:Uncharacterized protein n=1 Tax=Colletotrichum spaethianum TaxID=700344 RepID=A0AA37PD23_9PEZI|nr:uncharacterized protein ColSpa_10150 [Colletotrichum spaethianum]GKT49969.1 hypothetical protein ColSpa_10150 [Colletotrichum spaethianum]
MDSASNISIVNGDVPSRRTADPNEAQRLQDERLQYFIGNDELPNSVLPHMTTSSKKSITKHKNKMSRKINEIIPKVQK